MISLTHLTDSNAERTVRDIIGGVALIAIGLIFGGSVFLGDFGPFSIIFDGLGVFFIVRGVWRMWQAKQGEGGGTA